MFVYKSTMRLINYDAMEGPKKGRGVLQWSRILLDNV